MKLGFTWCKRWAPPHCLPHSMLLQLDWVKGCHLSTPGHTEGAIDMSPSVLPLLLSLRVMMEDGV